MLGVQGCQATVRQQSYINHSAEGFVLGLVVGVFRGFVLSRVTGGWPLLLTKACHEKPSGSQE